MAFGRPTLYDPAYCARVEELGKQGKSVVQIAVDLGVDKKTLYNWQDEYPDFFYAMTRAKEAAQAWWEEQGFQGMWADKFNAAVWNKVMSCRFRDDYRESSHLEVSGNLGNMTDEQLEARIAALAGKSK